MATRKIERQESARWSNGGALQLTQVKIAGRGRATPAMRLSLWITYVAVVSGFAITGIQYVLTVWSR